MTIWCDATEAVAEIKDGQRIFVQGALATPTPLLAALVARGPELHDVEITHLHTYGPATYTDAEWAGHFHLRALFVADNTRAAVQAGRAAYAPVFLRDIPPLFAHLGELPIDVALVQVSPPDAHGYCSLGPSVDITRAAVDHARTVIALVNPQMPRTHGDTFVPLSRIDRAVHWDAPLYTLAPAKADATHQQIGRAVAALVEDGATLQLGIGAIPDAVLAALTDRRDLGIHSEMFADGVVDLVERGVITGARKSRDRGKIVASFVIGSQRVLDFIADNPVVALYPSDYTNDPQIIRQFTGMVAINSAVQVDLTGQVCAESIGPRMYSGVGGQLDFMSGAARAPHGKPIIALAATATPRHLPQQLAYGELPPMAGHISRIVPMLAPGAAVTTTRAHVHYVATEHGVAYLHGADLAERARRLIAIAAPEFREPLERAAYDMHLFNDHGP
ncbi:MAG: acetyl-CoA hydrolase/transferase family protein [Ktedonobacterales bacterium]|nr:acetyl-CoA hydrolase/transferase family protein [Ktedonobacterales bacterium]